MGAADGVYCPDRLSFISSVASESGNDVLACRASGISVLQHVRKCKGETINLDV